MIKWNVSKHDGNQIGIIADRMTIINPEIDSRDVTMSLTACHANGNPLDLECLFLADDSNFIHDVLGICRHINKKTGKLNDYFVPRYSSKDKGK